MAKVFTGEYVVLSRFENLCYTIAGVDPEQEMTWTSYAKSLLWFNLCGFSAVFFIQLCQYYLPLNPQQLQAPSLDLAFNTAISFVTNTNWQAYSGENTLSYFTQMVGLTVQNFLSAVTGLAVSLVLVRGFARKTSLTIGNFWVDIVRSTFYIFLPLSIIVSLVLVCNGVVQTFAPYAEVTTLENTKQQIPLGPVASQIAIKQLGTNGGGYFGANSAHPFENPNLITNFIEMLAILLIPAGLVYSYGIMIDNKKHGVLLLLIMFSMLAFGLAVGLPAEMGNLEGKETRFGIVNDMLWTLSTTATANGSVNAMIDSMSPLSGGIAMFNIMLGELIFGGVGVGLCSMLLFILLTVFLSGLMVGRTPEYLGKKIRRKEIQWVTVAILAPGALILVGSSLSCVSHDGLSSLGNKGPHGLSEILYAFTSCAGNNGSAFGGLNVNTPFYNISLGFVMLLGRVAIVIPSLALGGLFAAKKISPPSAGTFSTDTLLFAILLLGVIVIVGGLTFFPALALGPIVEHLLMLRGVEF